MAAEARRGTPVVDLRAIGHWSQGAIDRLDTDLNACRNLIHVAATPSTGHGHRHTVLARKAFISRRARSPGSQSERRRAPGTILLLALREDAPAPYRRASSESPRRQSRPNARPPAARRRLLKRRDDHPRGSNGILTSTMVARSRNDLPPPLVSAASLQAEAVRGSDHVHAVHPVARVDAVDHFLRRLRHNSQPSSAASIIPDYPDHNRVGSVSMLSRMGVVRPPRLAWETR